MLWALPSSCLLFHVQQMTEEAVTRKFVREDSSHIVSYCGASVARSREK